MSNNLPMKESDDMEEEGEAGVGAGKGAGAGADERAAIWSRIAKPSIRKLNGESD